MNLLYVDLGSFQVQDDPLTPRNRDNDCLHPEPLVSSTALVGLHKSTGLNILFCITPV